MKYGNTLSQRSIPEWAAYNVDYNEIKHLIKARTTDAEAQAIPVPGGENKTDALKKLEDELYVELLKQHQRVDLFVQSKSGEIKRRLDHLHQQISQLKRHNPCGEQSRISVRRLGRYSKVEEAILRAGDEIQSLSRFVGAQRLAFQKLLKKYTRWTGSQTLGQRVEREILGRPSSFSHQTFESSLTAWTDALASVRAPFTPEGLRKIAGESKEHVATMATPTPARIDVPKRDDTREAHETPVKFSSSVAQLHDAAELGTGLDLDAALATVPLGKSAGTAAYWVHPDNLVELQVFLLQHMRLQSRRKPSNSSECPTSFGQFGETSESSHENPRSSRTEDDVGHIVLGNIDCFTERESGLVMSEKSLQNAPASIRYCASGAAIAFVRVSIGCTDPEVESMDPLFRRAKTKMKYLENLLDPCVSGFLSHEPFKEVKNGTSKQGLCSGQDLESIREWFAQHPDVRPLVDVQSRRTRLIGVGNNTTHGFWATLDRAITMKRRGSRQLGISADFTPPNTCGDERTEAVRFPYAVLELRWEETKGDDLAQALDNSHLVERVEGFSLGTHAVAVLYKSIFTPPPSWFTMLGKDIRKVPAPTVLPRLRQLTQRSFPDFTSTEHTSASTKSTGYGRTSNGVSSPAGDTPSTSVTDMLESSPLRAPTNKARQQRDQLRRQIKHPSRSQRRGYWNEFDDGDQASDPEAYTIFVDPHTSKTLPGAAGISRLANFINSTLTLSIQKIKQHLRPPPSTTHNARSPLISKDAASDPEIVSSPIDDDDALSAPHTHATYSTFPTLTDSQSQPVQTRDRLLLRLSIASFVFSLTTLLIAASLASSTRRKPDLFADLGILVGVIAASTSAVTGLALMCSRDVSMAWLWWGLILLGIVSICGGCCEVLAVMASV